MESSAVESAALARLHDYLRRAEPTTEGERLIASDAFISGFRAGCRWGVLTSGQLSDPRFREAIGVLAEVVRES